MYDDISNLTNSKVASFTKQSKRLKQKHLMSLFALLSFDELLR